MFDRLRRALIQSYVGAVGLGYMLAQGIAHFVNIFGAPLAGWVARNEYGEAMSSMHIHSRSAMEYATPEIVRFVGTMLVWYALMRWLYFQKNSSAQGERT